MSLICVVSPLQGLHQRRVTCFPFFARHSLREPLALRTVHIHVHTNGKQQDWRHQTDFFYDQKCIFFLRNLLGFLLPQTLRLRELVFISVIRRACPCCSKNSPRRGQLRQMLVGLFLSSDKEDIFSPNPSVTLFSVYCPSLSSLVPCSIPCHLSSSPPCFSWRSLPFCPSLPVSHL